MHWKFSAHQQIHHPLYIPSTLSSATFSSSSKLKLKDQWFLRVKEILKHVIKKGLCIKKQWEDCYYYIGKCLFPNLLASIGGFWLFPGKTGHREQAARKTFL